MALITDGLLIAAAIFAGTYCFVLSRRLRALKDLDSGVGGAIMRMTRALEDARRALEEAKAANRDGNRELRDLIVRAEAASGQLRILLSATRDLPAGRESSSPKAKATNRTEYNDEEEESAAAPDHARRPTAPSARREPLPLAAHTLAPALDPPEREMQRAARSHAPVRGHPEPAPPTEADLLAALADFAGARV